MKESLRVPRLVIAAQKGGAGKTLFTLGLIRILTRRGLRVAPFKKGPDYIDAGWLSRVAGLPCRNLDPFLMSPEQILKVFRRGIAGADVAVVEGNRGLFDGVDLEGSCSTARLARLLRAPVILLLDCTKVTRSLAALVRGFQAFEEGVEIRGVILNRVARPRHENIITRSIEHYTGVRVLGSLPRIRFPFPERHLGLVPWQEYQATEEFLEVLEGVFLEHLDSDPLIEIARQAPEIKLPEEERDLPSILSGVRIGVIRDRAFQFYYPENLEILEALGAKLIFLDALRDPRLPSLEALYIGGGFPETQAEALGENRSFLQDVREAGEGGLPIYAECGGLIYLGQTVSWKGRTYPLCGLLPLDFEIKPHPVGHGYTVVRVKEENPFYPAGTVLQGHEFHYSLPRLREGRELRLVLEVERGFGFDGKRDGAVYKRVFGTYTHLHAASTFLWVEGMLRAIHGEEVVLKGWKPSPSPEGWADPMPKTK
ncbi:MAG TPA: cobyrinate a,c-diamide synthase [Thermosulfurimonas dismutans]|uniref:Cobyrinate a,c-diamide synthase n=1 Tax=Thermosulfurimonas dismutans TaxID=999894 RepID=A0A7C3CLZ3_9BACT|nr:cobyrinate a,c-diamide synthase [Thermosulfurimonas dismutans]